MADFVHFINVGSTTCITQGYPGAAVLDGSGRQVYQATRTTNGSSGGLRPGQAPPLVVLHPGEEATALVQTGTENGSGNLCPVYPALLITPPDTTRSTRVAVNVPACVAPSITPLVAGTTGNG